MILSWQLQAWSDYQYWQSHDKKLVKRINLLVKDIIRQPYDGVGKPEPLKHEFSGYWSRRITDEHRLVYKAESDHITIAQCRFHYHK